MKFILLRRSYRSLAVMPRPVDNRFGRGGLEGGLFT
jgi:hypothetical protein